VLDDNHRPSKIFHHIVGTPQSDDRLVYEEEDPGFFMGVGGSMLRRLHLHRHPRPRDQSNTGLLPTSDLTGKPQLVAARETGLEYSLSEGGDVFYILTNADGAKDFKIVQAPVDNPPIRENWTDWCRTPRAAG
jgi:oligopeptidase B